MVWITCLWMLTSQKPFYKHTPSHHEHTCNHTCTDNLSERRIESMSFLTNNSTWQHLSWAILYHVRKVWTPPTAIPPRMFIAQKIISLVISAPLWAAINFSSVHDGPACGHRSLTFSKRSINLSVHPATYPLMFSSSPVVFFSFSLAAGW